LNLDPLTERERTVLQAVVESYIGSAEPAGSRRLVQQFDLDVSPATVRNTMSDLETKGLLTHPHTSAGRMPTDLAYRYYVDTLMDRKDVSLSQEKKIHRELIGDDTGSELEVLVRRAARVLGLLTGELGLSVGPILAAAVLLRLDLVPIDSEKVLLVLTLESGVVRTVYVDIPTGLTTHYLIASATSSCRTARRTS
jgi:heat-inducible transcriptional repressor